MMNSYKKIYLYIGYAVLTFLTAFLFRWMIVQFPVDTVYSEHDGHDASFTYLIFGMFATLYVNLLLFIKNRRGYVYLILFVLFFIFDCHVRSSHLYEALSGRMIWALFCFCAILLFYSFKTGGAISLLSCSLLFCLINGCLAGERAVVTNFANIVASVCLYNFYPPPEKTKTLCMLQELYYLCAWIYWGVSLMLFTMDALLYDASIALPNYILLSAWLLTAMVHAGLLIRRKIVQKK